MSLITVFILCVILFCISLWLFYYFRYAKGLAIGNLLIVPVLLAAISSGGTAVAWVAQLDEEIRLEKEYLVMKQLQFNQEQAFKKKKEGEALKSRVDTLMASIKTTPECVEFLSHPEIQSHEQIEAIWRESREKDCIKADFGQK